MKRPKYPLDEQRVPIDQTVFSRARDFYLYTDKGIRFVDMDLAGGRAVFGHKTSGLITRIKQVLDKGILHQVNTPWKRRFERHTALLFPLHEFCGLYFYSHEPYSFADIPDDLKKNNITLWRPFASRACDDAPHEQQLQSACAMMIPLAWGLPLCVLLHFPHGHKKEEKTNCSLLSGSDALTGASLQFVRAQHVSPVVYGALCEALRMLGTHARRKTAEEETEATANPAVSFVNRNFPAEHKNKKNAFAPAHTKKELHGTKARSIQLALPAGWRQTGMYITAFENTAELSTKENYQRYYNCARAVFWRQGFVIPSSPHTPMSLPYFFSESELASWNAAVECISLIKL